MASKKRSKNPLEHRDRKRALNKAKRVNRRHRDDRTPRRKDWMDLVNSDGETVNDAGFERIMPPDENERRKAVEAHSEKIDAAPPVRHLVGTEGLVTEVSSGMCRVRVGDQTLLCTLRGSLTAQVSGFTNVVTVGDRVVITEADAVVEEILPRRNVIARPDPAAAHLRQSLVANVDQLLIVASWRNPHIWTELIDRYLITAARNDGITSVICVNKVDLANDPSDVEQVLAPYRALGHTILLTSVETMMGIDALREQLRGQISVVAGLSGVGKSSLLSATQPGFELRVSEVSLANDEGRHTTTQASMLPFGDDGYVIDTPGIREFGLGGLAAHDLMHFYPEISEVSSGCRFNDCLHVSEPDCAVRAAAESGDIPTQRYKDYLSILLTL